MGASSFQQRLREVIHALKLEHQEFARAGGITKATLSGYVQSDRQPKAETLGNWVSTYGIDANWLLVGEGKMFKGQAQAAPQSSEDPKSELGKELEDIKATLATVGASEDEIKQALLDYIRNAGTPRDQIIATETDDDSLSSAR